MSRFYLCSIISLTIAVAVLAGCTDECARASDCLRDEVCFDGSCEPALTNAVSCQSDLDCNGGVQLDDPPRICVSGACLANPGNTTQQCNVVPRCFQRGTADPTLTPQTMTATTGDFTADPNQSSAPMSEVVAFVLGTGQINIIGTNGTTTPPRQMCILLIPGSSTCARIQVADGDLDDDNTDIYETTACTANLASVMGDVQGDVAGRVENCDGDSFQAEADFNIAIQ